MSARGVLLLVGGLLLGVGLIFGFAPVSAKGASCGSAFIDSGGGAQQDLTNALIGDSAGVSAITDACQDSRSSRQPLALALAGAGVVVLAVGVSRKRTNTETPATHEG